MAIATISSKYQIVIPKEVRERMKLKPGQKLGILMKGRQAVLVPLRPIEELRGIAEGAEHGGLSRGGGSLLIVIELFGVAAVLPEPIPRRRLRAICRGRRAGTRTGGSDLRGLQDAAPGDLGGECQRGSAASKSSPGSTVGQRLCARRRGGQPQARPTVRGCRDLRHRRDTRGSPDHQRRPLRAVARGGVCRRRRRGLPGQAVTCRA